VAWGTYEVLVGVVVALEPPPLLPLPPLPHPKKAKVSATKTTQQIGILP
jgi:hypothetical protein